MQFKTENTNGVVLWEGPSALDNRPIVVVATGLTRKPRNEKTGNMIQVFILAQNVSPIHAISTGYDKTICGDCPLRGLIKRIDGKLTNKMRSCYVEVDKSVSNVWKAYRNNRYLHYDPSVHNRYLVGRSIRLGAYGDPVAMPYGVTKQLVDLGRNHTGYTHQWKQRRFWRWRRLVMASCETIDEANLARSRGWRTFRTMPTTGETQLGEFLCPASEEAGKRLSCEQCGACNGSGNSPDRASVTIFAHGGKGKLSSYARLVS